MNNKNTASILL